MANLQQDLLNNLGNEKYYAELELGRLAGDPNMVYKNKVEQMAALLKELAALDLSTQLVGKYFQQPQQAAPAPAPEQQGPAPEQPQVHPGQSHGE